jgi:hypothetical protein
MMDEVKSGVPKRAVSVGADSRPADKSDNTATIGFSAFASGVFWSVVSGLNLGMLEGELFVGGLAGLNFGTGTLENDES